jgi:hypothetical protein
MPGDAEIDDPLLRAIAELRDEVNRLIDEQVASAKERDRAGEPSPAHARRPAPSPSMAAATAEPARARPLDPSQRLDALARHLDHRRRLNGSPTPDRAGRPTTTEG